MDPPGSPDGFGVRTIVIELNDCGHKDTEQPQGNEEYDTYSLCIIDTQLKYVPTLTRFELRGFRHLKPEGIPALKAVMPGLHKRGILYVTIRE